MAMIGPIVKSAVLQWQSLPAETKKYLIGGAVFLCLLLVVALKAARDEPEVVAPYLHRVDAFQVSGSAHYEEVRLFSGRVSARQHADMGFEQGGKLAEVLVDAGELVEQGNVLAILDSELLHIEEREQLAQLREAKAKLKLTENSLTRQTSLKRSGFTSEQRLDELKTDKESLLAKIASLDAAAAAVASRVRKASLIAPFDGVVTRRFVDQGGAVNPGQAVLRLQQSGAMEAHIGVPLQQAVNVSLGSVHSVSVAGERYSATVLAVGADLHPLTRTLMVRLGLEATKPLVNGSLATLTLARNVQKAGYWVPASAMSGGVRGLWNVLMLKPEGEDKYRIETRAVEVLYTLDGQVFVNGDLHEGESIVSTGGHRVVAGQMVRQISALAEPASEESLQETPVQKTPVQEETVVEASASEEVAQTGIAQTEIKQKATAPKEAELKTASQKATALENVEPKEAAAEEVTTEILAGEPAIELRQGAAQ